MRRLLLSSLLGCLALSLALTLDADERKKIEQRLKTIYKGAVVALPNRSAGGGVMRLEVPEELAQTIDADRSSDLRIEELKLKKAELEFRARRVHFFQDSQRQLRGALGPLWKYRLRWKESELSEDHLEAALERALIPAQPGAEEGEHVWPPDLPPGHEIPNQSIGPSVEVSPGMYTTGEDMTIPKCQYCPTPDYTPEAQLAKVNGLVVEIVLLSETGHVLGIRIGRSAGYGFDEATVAAIYTWRFTPALLRGKPVRVVMPVETRFNIYSPRD